ncbi:hypothetical protein ACLB2K_036661 [Fragaria x ananassa]
MLELNRKKKRETRIPNQIVSLCRGLSLPLSPAIPLSDIPTLKLIFSPLTPLSLHYILIAPPPISDSPTRTHRPLRKRQAAPPSRPATLGGSDQRPAGDGSNIFRGSGFCKAWWRRDLQGSAAGCIGFGEAGLVVLGGVGCRSTTSELRKTESSSYLCSASLALHCSPFVLTSNKNKLTQDHHRTTQEYSSSA